MEPAQPPLAAQLVWAGDSLVATTRTGFRFAGVRTPEGDTIRGTASQRGMTFPTMLTRVVRSQAIATPAPYSTRAVTIASTDSVRLAGTLTLPAGRGSFRAVVLISGSGPQDRDAAVLFHRPFALLADHLARQGIASLRYDERGVGASTGQYATARLADFTADAEAAMLALRGMAGINPARVGLLGHSEGGMVAPMIAAGSTKVAFLVLLAAPAVRGDSVFLLQARAIAAGAGVTGPARARVDSLNWVFYQDVRAAADSSAEAAAIMRYVDALLVGVDPAQHAAVRAQLLPQARAVLSPEVNSLLRADPQAVLRQVRVPVLALFGGKDVQVPAGTHRAALVSALAAGGNRRVDARELEGLNHLFQPATTGLPAEYFDSPVTMAPAVFEAISRQTAQTASRRSGRFSRVGRSPWRNRARGGD